MIRIAALVVIAATAALADTPVVIELFTSEGCSSCPPADRLLAEIDGKPLAPGVEIIALSEHVDYWDDLGWRDKFSSPLFSARQTEYGQAFRQEGIYTPQAVINGQAQCLGSDLEAIRRAVREVGLTAKAVVEIKKLTSDTVSFRVANLPAGTKESDMLLAIAEDGLQSNVAGGENGGRRLRHVAVVRSLTRLGTLDPKKKEIYTSQARVNLKREWNPSNIKLVLLVQDRTTKRIVGAASLRL